jgi:DNA-binding CsgD family transcriptional regulator
MDRDRRRRVKREIVSLCSSGLDVDTLYREAMRQVSRLVPYDRICWHTVDPVTKLLTSATEHNLGHEPRLPAYEYEIPDVNKWAYLAGRPLPAGVLSHATHGHPEQSPRFRDLLAPRGIAHELRASLVSENRCWGCLGLFRDRGGLDFAEEEAAFVAETGAQIAAGIRRALLLNALAMPRPSSDVPGVLILDAAGDISAMNATAGELISLFPDDCEPPAQPVPHIVLAVAAQARRAACGSDETPARSRARTLTGQWVVLHGTRLGDMPGAPTAVIIEPARSAELAELIVLAYGFTPREREVTRLVVLGLSTTDIAQKLHLSPFTVQDYLKNIFDKVGVRTRRELVATVFRDHYWPRVLASEKASAGGFFDTRHTTPAATPDADR